MEKEYLIHNIDYKDNPEDQHTTIDITLSNLELAGQDITADVGIDTFVNGMPTSSNKYEDVNLTGSGGGGSSDFSTAIVTFNILGRDPDGGGGWDNIVSIINDNLNVVPDFSNFELPGNSTEIVLYKGHAIGTANGMGFSVSGSATWDENTSEIDITGDCTISYTAAGLA